MKQTMRFLITLVALMAGGFERAPLFGGAGLEPLASLAPGEVYAMLVPEGVSHFNMMAQDGKFTYAETLGYGESIYMVPEPAAVVILVLGGALAMLCHRRRGCLLSA